MKPGSRARGRTKTNCMNNVTSWTGLKTEAAIRAADGKEVWIEIVCRATNSRIEDGWRQDRTPVTFNHQVLGQTLQFQHDWYEHSITQHWLTRWIVNAFRFWAFFRLDALALSVIATATWLAGWLGGCHTPVLYQNR